MNSGLTSERVYTALKRRLLDGEFRPGERLDPAHLSETLSSSVTPVRDVLNILRGEGLVETRTGEGFFRPNLTAPDLEDVYDWSDQILALALRQWPAAPAPAHVYDPATGPIADRTADLFLEIATRSANFEHKRAIVNVNDRLHAARMIEGQVLDDTEAELTAIAQVLANDDARELEKLVFAYHQRRRRAVSDIVRAVYRG